MGFDLAIGVSGAELSTASAAVYGALYPKVFRGSTTVTYKGLTFDVSWDVQAAPAFDLSTPVDPSERRAALERRAGVVSLAGAPAGAEGPDLAAMAAVLPAFVVTLPTVALTLHGPTTTDLTLPLTAYCSVDLTGSTLQFVVNRMTAPTQSDPVTNALVQTVVVPAIEGIVQTLFQGITIPPLTVTGVALSAPSAGIVNGAVIAAANVASSGTPPPPDASVPWPGAPFFALLGPNLVQAAMEVALASATNRFSDKGHGGNHWAGYHWSYGLSLTSPETSIQGTSIDIALSLSGGVDAGVEVVYVPLSIGFVANALPKPSVLLTVAVRGSQVMLVTQKVQPFTILVRPADSVPSWVLGWLVAAIVDGVVTTLTPLVTQFLNGIAIPGFTIPTYTVSVQGTDLTLTPNGLQAGSAGGYLALVGQISVS